MINTGTLNLIPVRIILQFASDKTRIFNMHFVWLHKKKGRYKFKLSIPTVSEATNFIAQPQFVSKLFPNAWWSTY